MALVKIGLLKQALDRFPDDALLEIGQIGWSDLRDAKITGPKQDTDQLLAWLSIGGSPYRFEVRKFDPARGGVVRLSIDTEDPMAKLSAPRRESDEFDFCWDDDGE